MVEGDCAFEGPELVVLVALTALVVVEAAGLVKSTLWLDGP